MSPPLSACHLAALLAIEAQNTNGGAHNLWDYAPSMEMSLSGALYRTDLARMDSHRSDVCQGRLWWIRPRQWFPKLAANIQTAIA
jgi:hypothetical protein